MERTANYTKQEGWMDLSVISPVVSGHGSAFPAHARRMQCTSACLIMQMLMCAFINMWDTLSEVSACFLCVFALFSICHEMLLNLKPGCLRCSFWVNLFSIFQFRWSATLTMLRGIWDGPGTWRSRGEGWMGALRWSRQASGQAQAPLFYNNKDPHWNTLRPCNPRGHRGPPACLGWDKWTQMLPVNAEQPGCGNEGGGVGGSDRKRGGSTSFFFPLPLVEAVICCQIPVLSHNHWSQRPPCKEHCGKLSERHLSLKENESSSKSLSPFLFLFLSSCHLDWERRRERENDGHVCPKDLIEVEVLDRDMKSVIKCSFNHYFYSKVAGWGLKYTMCVNSDNMLCRFPKSRFVQI